MPGIRPHITPGRKEVKCPRHRNVVMNGVRAKERGARNPCKAFFCRLCEKHYGHPEWWVRKGWYTVDIHDDGRPILDYYLEPFDGDILEPHSPRLL